MPRDPDIAIWPEAELAGWERFGYSPHFRSDVEPADLVGVVFGEPDVAVRAGRDGVRPAVGRGDRVLRNPAVQSDAPDLVRVALGEPEGTVAADRHEIRAIRRGHGELAGDLT